MNIINLKGGLHVTPKNLPWLRACTASDIPNNTILLHLRNHILSLNSCSGYIPALQSEVSQYYGLCFDVANGNILSVLLCKFCPVIVRVYTSMDLCSNCSRILYCHFTCTSCVEAAPPESTDPYKKNSSEVEHEYYS